MGVITVKRTRKNGFMTAINRPLMRRVDKDGKTIDTKGLDGAGIPGTRQGKVIKYDAKKRKFPVSIPKEELDKLVKEMALYDSEGAITECNIRNSRDRFITHPEMKLHFEENSTSYDDDDPKGIIWRNYMENIGDFKPKTSSKEMVGLVQGASEYTYVENKSLERAEEEEQLDELARANNLLANMDFQTRIKVLRSMGTKVEAKEANPEVIDRILTKKVFVEGNTKRYAGKTNLDLFLEFGSLPNDVLNLKSNIKEARDKRIITKVTRGDSWVYKYGETPLGSTLLKVEEFLKDKDNEEVLTDIIDDLQNS